METRRSGSKRRTETAYLVALVFLALAFAFAPAAAHLLALPNKIHLDRDAYFTVQQIYRGWALLGVVVIGALLSTLYLTFRVRHVRRALIWAAAACLCVVGAQALFWIFTYPANAATANWTTIPENWEALRARWEYSHAAAAVLDLGALIAAALSLLAWHRHAPVAPRPVPPADGTDTLRWPQRVSRAADSGGRAGGGRSARARAS